MALEKNLSISPYFDDFNEDKNFHRVLYRPGRAVQARELTQMQTILQNQLERFANEVLVDGSIVTGVGGKGGAVSYVKLRDKDANTRVLLLGDFYEGGNIANAVVYGTTTGLEAKLVDAKEGSEAAAPNTLTLFVNYTNSGANNTTKYFNDGEVLVVRRSSNNEFLVAANTTTSNSTGYGYIYSIGDGIIYHKGHFIKVSKQNLIVDRYSQNPTKKIGFETVESIVDSNQDSSLLDNATGATNYSAPGADRLKLEPTLATRNIGTANTTTFVTIATVENGLLVNKVTDTTYSDIARYMSERVYETNGNFTIEPFNVDIKEHLRTSTNLGMFSEEVGGDQNKLIAVVEKGIGYVSGNRIHLTDSVYREVDKATDYDVKDARVIGQAFGNYVYAEEVTGIWDFQGLRSISLRNAAQNAITSKTYGATTAQGTEIGTARIRGIQWEQGTMGTILGRFRIYLFDVQMSSGYSFSDVRGLFCSNSTANALADIVLEENGTAKLQEPSLLSLVFPFSQRGTKTLKDASNNVDTQFVFRTEKTVNFTAAGTATVTANTAHAGGTETMNDTGAPLSNVDERNILVISRASVDTNPMTGRVSAFSGNTVTGTSTLFQTAYRVGEMIKIVDGANTISKRITDIPSQTSIRTSDTFAYTRSGVTLPHRKTFPAGYIFDLSTNGSITSTSTQHQISLGQANLSSTFSASVYFDILRSSAVQAMKTVNKDKYVKINTGSHSASKNGPWPLGVSDVYKITAIYKGSNTGVTASSTDVTSEFILDTGMKDSHYDTSYLKKKPTSTLNLTNCGLLVKFNYFGRDVSAGISYLSVDSYPVDDTNTANTSAITTQEIPIYLSPTTGKTYDLRDSVDFRPIKSSTATPDSTVGSAPINPTASSTYSINSDGAYLPTPDQNFQADVQYYLPRKDRIVMTERGTVEVIKGVPANIPRTPSEPAGSMTVAVLNIPVYPSLSSYNANLVGRQDYSVKLNLVNNRRYTMQDLRAVESRVKNLEYYSSLSVLETSAKNKQLLNDTGIDRYKNGILVDDFNNFNVSDTNKVGYRAAIDINTSTLRPSFIKKVIPMAKDKSLSSSNVVKVGNMITLAYTHVDFYNQPFASKLRNPTQELTFEWRGEVQLNPSMDNTPDIITLPDIQVDYNGTNTNAYQLSQLTGVNTVWGDWEITDVAFKDVNKQYDNGDVYNSTGAYVTGTAVSDQIRSGLKATTSFSVERVSLGNQVVNTSVVDYMRSKVVQFTGYRMKPDTRVYAYFDNLLVSDYCTPANSSFGATGTEGSEIVTDSSGTVYGLFRIPNNDNIKFRTGTKRFALRDIANTQTQSAIMTTSAHGDYTSNPLSITQRGTYYNIVVPQISYETVVESRTVEETGGYRADWLDSQPGSSVIQYDATSSKYANYICPTDPLSQTFDVILDNDSPGVFITKVGLYFGKKSSIYPVTVHIREVENGFPTRRVVPFASKTLQPSEITVNLSAATDETQFVFDSPVFLKNGAEYCLVIIPAGNSTDYAVWVGELGQKDVDTDELIDKQPASGVMFTSSNDKSWSVVQSEDLKFKLYRADFTTSTGTVYIENDDVEFTTYSSMEGELQNGEVVKGESVLTFANNRVVPVGSIIKSKAAQSGAATSNSNYANGVVRKIVSSTAHTVTVKVDNFQNFPTSASSNTNNLYVGGTWVGNTSAFTANTVAGLVDFIDVDKKKVQIINTSGSFGNNYVRGQTSGGSIKIDTVDNQIVNVIVPKIPELNYPSTSTSWSVRSTSTSGVISPTYSSVTLEASNEFLDGEKKLYSKTNEAALASVSGSKKSLVLKGTLSTTDTRVSPIIDVSRANVLLLENTINNLSTDEHKEVGSALVRYITKPIELADGQDAEDMLVYLSAYKPQGTDVKVYVRIHNPEDSEDFGNKDYTPLEQITSASVYSDSVNINDVKEFEFGFSSNTYNFLASSNNHAYLNTANNGVVSYRSSNGSKYHTYKTFAVKIVLTSSGTNIVPLVKDMRCVALQK